MPTKRTFTDQEIDNRQDTLPSDVLAVFEGKETSKKILDIGRGNALPIDAIGKLAEEIGYVLLGLVPSKEFISDLEEIVGDKNKAQVVALEVNEKIFVPIRETLRKIYQDKWSGDITNAGSRVIAGPPPSRPPLPQRQPESQVATQPIPPAPRTPVLPQPVKPIPPPVKPPAPPTAEKLEPMIIGPRPRVANQLPATSNQQRDTTKIQELKPILPEISMSEKVAPMITPGGKWPVERNAADSGQRIADSSAAASGERIADRVGETKPQPVEPDYAEQREAVRRELEAQRQAESGPLRPRSEASKQIADRSAISNQPSAISNQRTANSMAEKPPAPVQPKPTRQPPQPVQTSPYVISVAESRKPKAESTGERIADNANVAPKAPTPQAEAIQETANRTQETVSGEQGTRDWALGTRMDDEKTPTWPNAPLSRQQLPANNVQQSAISNQPTAATIRPPAPSPQPSSAPNVIMPASPTQEPPRPSIPPAVVPPPNIPAVNSGPAAGQPSISQPSPHTIDARPLKLPQQRIPKPPAPERYNVDPYKEPVE